MRIARVLAVLALAASLSAGAAVPTTISFQGYLTSGGVPVNSTVNLTVNLYSVASGGVSIWAESHNGVAVANGIYNIVLGSTQPLDETVLNGQLYLGVTVAPDAEMAPRMPLTSAPYAIRAKALDVTLGVSGGGTGLVNAPGGGLLYGTGTDALGITGAGSVGQVLTATAGGVPQWSNSSGPDLLISHAGAGTFTIQTAGQGVVVQDVRFESGNIEVGNGRVLFNSGVQVVGARQAAVLSVPAAVGTAQLEEASPRFVLSGTCGMATVPNNGSCTVVVTYNPLAGGGDTATLRIATVPWGSYSINLAAAPGTPGGPVPGVISVSTSSVTDLASSSPQTITFTNTSGDSVMFGGPYTGFPAASVDDLYAVSLRLNALLERLRNHGLIEP